MTAIPKRPKLTRPERDRAYALATQRDENLCQRCLRDCGWGVTSRHHRQPRDAFNTVLSNVVVLGGTGTTGCHGWATTSPADAIRDGWSMPRHTFIHPSEWPARRWLPTGYGTFRLAWVRYLDAPDDGVWWVELSDQEAQRRLEEFGFGERGAA